MNTRWIIALMAVGLVSLAIALDRFPLPEESFLGALARREWFHLVAHTVLYGSLAVALATRWFPSHTIDAPRAVLVRHALAAAVCFMFIAGAQELAQALCRARLPGGEEAFDLVVDIVGASAGLILWSRPDRKRKYLVARTLGVVLHPGFVGPAGVFAVTWSALEDARAALTWTLVAVVAALPVAGVWVAGLRRGWYSDRDLSVRTERPLFLVTATLMAVSLALVTRGAGAPEVVRALTFAGACATALLTVLTVAGVKVSGHVAVPVGVVALLQATSFRGPWPFLLAACVLSWARVREGRHTPVEVLAGWGVATSAGFFTRWVA